MAISSISTLYLAVRPKKTLYLAGAPSIIAPPQLLRAHRPSSLQIRRRSLAIAASAAEDSPESTPPRLESVPPHVFFYYVLILNLNDWSAGVTGAIFITECMRVGIDSGKLDQLRRCFEAATESEVQSNTLSLPEHRIRHAAVLFFDRPEQELDALSARELVDLLINACMYAGIDRGKLDLLRRCFEEGAETIEYCVNCLRTAYRQKEEDEDEDEDEDGKTRESTEEGN